MVFVLWIYLVLIFGDYNKYLRGYIPELLSGRLALSISSFSVSPFHPVVPVSVSCWLPLLGTTLKLETGGHIGV